MAVYIGETHFKRFIEWSVVIADYKPDACHLCFGHPLAQRVNLAKEAGIAPSLVIEGSSRLLLNADLVDKLKQSASYAAKMVSHSGEHSAQLEATPAADSSGSIHIELPGRALVSVENGVDPALYPSEQPHLLNGLRLILGAVQGKLTKSTRTSHHARTQNAKFSCISTYASRYFNLCVRYFNLCVQLHIAIARCRGF